MVYCLCLSGKGRGRMEKEAKEYYATVSPYGDTWIIRFYEDDEHIRSQSSGFRWHARWVARKGLKRLRTKTEIIR